MSKQQKSITKAIFKIANKLYRHAFKKADYAEQVFAIREYTGALECLLAVTLVTNPTKETIIKDILEALHKVQELEKKEEFING